MSDTDHLIEQVLALLRRRLGSRLYEVRVLARDGGVILQGRSRSYYAKQLAQHVVMQILRLAVVANEIEVLLAAPAPDPDGADPK